jgi:Flp pilus assembly protein TadB
MSAEPRHPLNKNVSPNWKPPAGLAERKAGMMWSDRIWHWLVCLGGLCIVGVGVAVMVFMHLGRLGGVVVGIGFAVFVLGFPSAAQRNGYRE